MQGRYQHHRRRRRDAGVRTKTSPNSAAYELHSLPVREVFERLKIRRCGAREGGRLDGGGSDHRNERGELRRIGGRVVGGFDLGMGCVGFGRAFDWGYCEILKREI